MYNLPTRLKQLRTSLNLTQTQIAEKLGMTYQEYQKIENGKTIIRADKLYHICETLNTSADWLLNLNIDVQTVEVNKQGSVMELPQRPKLRVPDSGELSELDRRILEENKELMKKVEKRFHEMKKQSSKNIG